MEQKETAMFVSHPESTLRTRDLDPAPKFAPLDISIRSDRQVFLQDFLHGHDRSNGNPNFLPKRPSAGVALRGSTPSLQTSQVPMPSQIQSALLGCPHTF